MAARIAGIAAGGEVLLSAATAQAAGPVAGVRYVERGAVRLKNVSEPVALLAARADTSQTVSALVIDPVCRMAINQAHSAGQLSHRGITYSFCSLVCVARFSADPEVFTVSGV